MPTCLCCARNLPVSEKKTCPLCGHGLMGRGWWGIDYHWEVRHELDIPYRTFWDGLCDAHRSVAPEGGAAAVPVALVHAIERPPEAITKAFDTALDRRSAQLENRLTRTLIAAIAEELWRRDHWLDLQVFKDEADDSGYDLVLGSNGAMRYIQVRHVALEDRAGGFRLRQDPARRAGGCAVVLVYRADTLEIDHCLYFGGAAGEPPPALTGCPAAVASGAHGADRRENCRDVPRRRFAGPLTLAETVEALFPGMPARDSATEALPPVPLSRLADRCPV
jgi:hypothetical protein